LFSFLSRGLQSVWLPIALMAANLLAWPASAEIARDIETKTEELRALSDDDSNAREKIAVLEAAIKRGERASAGLWTQIKSLEAEKEALEDEKRALEKIQVVLTSGLIGALVTAFVAILGVAINFARGRAERDLKRLEVLEKSVELESKGINIPEDIQAAYKRQNSVL
jgi:HAMP domain-containing protein